MGANCTSVSHLQPSPPPPERASNEASKPASPPRHNPLTLVPIRAQRRRTKRRSRRAQGKGCDAKAFVVVLTRNSGEEIVNGRGGGSRNLSPVLTRDMEGSHAAIPPSWEPDCLIYNPRRAKKRKAAALPPAKLPPRCRADAKIYAAFQDYHLFVIRRTNTDYGGNGLET